MRCEEALPLLGAFTDGEVTEIERQSVEAHLASCTDCRVLVEEQCRISQLLKAAAYQRAPPDLADRIFGHISLAEKASNKSPRVTGRREGWPRPFLQRAAVLVLVGALSGIAGSLLTRAYQQRSIIAHDIVAAHVRSLLSDQAVQVASSDQHTVKPWFTGRLEFAPEVRDLSKNGFTLVGGRLDYVNDVRTAAIVYRRRKHIINLFIWPRAGSGNDTFRATLPSLSVKGFNNLSWQKGDLSFWAISDLNETELRQFRDLLLE
jgi:anti-sigma factor (TIGR02949 family)